MRVDAHASSDDIDVARLLAIVRRRLPKLLVFSAISGALTFGLLSLVAPRYVSESQFAIVSKSEADPARVGASADSVSVRVDKEAVNTHVRALSSSALAAKIARDMKLAQRVEFNDALGSEDRLSALLRVFGIGWPRVGESDQDRVLSAYFKRLEVYSPEESRLIGIRFFSSDPQLASAVANRIAETYRERLADQSMVEGDEVEKALRAVPVEAQIITAARPSTVPVFPKKLPYTLLIMAATLLFGLAITVTRGLLAGVRLGSKAQRGLGAAGRATLDEDLSPVVFLDVEPDSPSRVRTVSTLTEIAHRIESIKAAAGRGVRTLIAGDVYALNAGDEAVELALNIAAKGHGVIVVDWSPEGGGVLAVPNVGPGIIELIDGAAKFEDAVECLEHSDVHFIRAGRPRSDASWELDPDRINVILDALDEVYDHIIIVGRREAARRLFEAIQGRFDCGIVVSDAKRRAAAVGDSLNTFLGYEVDDIALIRFERPERHTRLSERVARGSSASVQHLHAR